MHSKTKGNIGVLAVAKILSLNEINVFTELGDLSRIDLIGEKAGKIVRIQVKSLNSFKKELVKVSVVKTGPANYCYSYKKEDFDFFAIYVRDLDKTIFISSEEALNCTRQVSFRITEPKGANENEFRYFKDYESVKPILEKLK